MSTTCMSAFLIRCGRCFNQPGPVKDGVAPGMYITECKHLLCTRCVQDKMIGGGVISKCLVCHKDKVQTMALDGSVRLPRKVALLLYGDLSRILSQLNEALDFQTSHSDRFVKYVCDSKASIDKGEDELRRLREENCAIEEAVAKLDAQLKGLKDHNRSGYY